MLDVAHPIAGELVALGTAKTTTDAAGRFTFAHAPSTYDLILASPDHARATIFRKLTARSPRLNVSASPAQQKPAHHATVSGTLSGSIAAGSMHVSFLGKGGVKTDALVTVKADATTASYSLDVPWDGAPDLDGELLALQLPDLHSDHDSSFVRARISLHDQKPASADLVLAPVASVTRAGHTVANDGLASGRWDSAEYDMPGYGKVFAACGPFRQGVDFRCADPVLLGATLCNAGAAFSPYFRSAHMRCALNNDESLSLHLRAGPEFARPAWGAAPALGLVFEWSRVERSIYRLTLKANDEQDAPTPEHPQIEIVTAAQSDAWPNLELLGVAFPQSPAGYIVTVAALGPYTAVDDFVKAEPDLIRAESWRATSRDLGLILGHPSPMDMPEQLPPLPPGLSP